MKEMWKGNHAIAEAAMRAGCKFFAGYPITPQTEVGEYLSARMPELGRRFIQAENEMSAIYMLFGASYCGMRCMTSSSGPGFSLKQEGISFMCANGLPAVLVNVIRWGNGLGSLDSSQSDYLRDTRGGGNGDYRLVVFAPNSIQEMVDFIYDAWEVSEKYKNPVEILAEASLGQMMEPVNFPEFKDRTEPLSWEMDGAGGVHGRVDSGGGKKTIYNREKIALMEENEQRWENYMADDAEYIFVSYGLPSRSTKNAVNMLRENGVKAGLIRPRTVWPFPHKAFSEVAAKNNNVKAYISVESTDAGQVIEDVALAAKKSGHGMVPVYGMFTGQNIPKAKEIVEFLADVQNGKVKEVF